MKHIVSLLALATLLFGVTGCATGPQNKATTPLIGAALGAAAGAIIGEGKGRELEGAAIGGTIGTGVGTVIEWGKGKTLPHQQASAPPPQPAPSSPAPFEPYFGDPE